MKIYFAGPLFNQAERKFNAELTEKLEALGFKVFLPQRDGVDGSKPPFDAMLREDRRKHLFNLDRDKILESDIFLFILDGRVPDEGACVELGMAYSQKYQNKKEKLLIGLQTDNRAVHMNTKLNPMIQVALDKVFSTEEELIMFLKNNPRGKGAGGD